MPNRRLIFAVVAAACLLAPGCSDDRDSEGPSVRLTITRDFGRAVVASDDRAQLNGRRTQLRLLRDNFEVEAPEGGLYVEALDGLRVEPEGSDGQETAWVSNVNGFETDLPPAEYPLHPGDVVQWDLRDWYVRFDVRATVGAFPQTFTRGFLGRTFPVSVECERPDSPPCRRVEAALRRAGVTLDDSRARKGPLPERGDPRRAKILVGRWAHWREGAWAKRIDRGPAYSGVFGRFSENGKRLRMLDWDGRVVREAGPGTGLVAAMLPTDEDLRWYVTGVDDAGVGRAARALDAEVLRNAFSVAITSSGVEKLPLPPKATGGS